MTLHVAISRTSDRSFTKGKEYAIEAIVTAYQLKITDDNDEPQIISMFDDNFLVCLNRHDGDTVSLGS